MKKHLNKKKVQEVFEESESNSIEDPNIYDDVPSIRMTIDDSQGRDTMFIEISSFFHDEGDGKIGLLKNNEPLQELLMKVLQVELQNAFRNAVHSVTGEPFGINETIYKKTEMINEVRKMQKIAGIIKESYDSMEEDLSISKNEVPQIRKTKPGNPSAPVLANTGDETRLGKAISQSGLVKQALGKIDQPASELDGAFQTLINSFGLKNVDASVVRAQLEKVLKSMRDEKGKISSAPGSTGKDQVNISKNEVPQVRKTGGFGK